MIQDKHKNNEYLHMRVKDASFPRIPRGTYKVNHSEGQAQAAL